MKNILLIVGLLLILGIAFYFTQRFVADNQGGMLNTNKGAKATIEGESFNLLVADTDQEKQVGLSGRKSLPKKSGMIFTYDKEGYHTFWMRNMQFPIDIIFIKDGKIVTIHKNVAAPKSSENLKLYQPESPVDTIIEVNAGVSDEFKFEKGDTVAVTL